MTRAGMYSRSNDTHETGPPKSEQLPFHDFPGEMWFLELLSTLGSRSALSNAIWVVQLA